MLWARVLRRYLSSAAGPPGNACSQAESLRGVNRDAEMYFGPPPMLSWATLCIVRLVRDQEPAKIGSTLGHDSADVRNGLGYQRKVEDLLREVGEVASWYCIIQL